MEPFPTEVQLCKIKSFGQRGTVPTNRTPLREEHTLEPTPGCTTAKCNIANQGDDDDSIVKHKLATTAVREKPSTSAARVVEARARLPRGLC
ncbi:hypothetical protein EMCRGX_G015349 [Ephydatia muelleri]